jgi:hypothetical protein
MIQQAAPPKNRRRALRRCPKRATRVACFRGDLGLGPNLALELLDVSETGVRVRVRESLENGKPVEIQLTGLAHPRPFKLLARVIWCVPAADGSFCVGARFDKGLRYGDVQLLA